MPNVTPPPPYLCPGIWVCIQKDATGNCTKWECDMGGGSDPTPEPPLPSVPSPPGGGISPSPKIPSISIPIASFTYQLYTKKVVVFTNTSLGHAVKYKWDFGDGDISYSENPIHIYRATGSYSVTLYVYNSVGNYTSDAIGISVTSLLPMSDFSYVKLGLKVFFINTSTIYGASYAWDFGDGEYSTEKNPEHNYPVAGDYTVSLIVNGIYRKEEVMSVIESITFEDKFGSLGTGDGQFLSPVSVVTDDDYIYVSDQGLSNVQRFNKTTLAFVDKITFIDCYGGNCQPSGIAVDDDYLYVAWSNYGTTRVYNKSDLSYTGFEMAHYGDVDVDDNFVYISSLSASKTYTKGTWALFETITPVNNVRGIAVDDNFIYRSLAAAYLLKFGYIHNKTSPYSLISGFAPSTDFNSPNPYNITVDDKYIYITNAAYHTQGNIQIYNKTSPYSLMTTFGSYGSGDGQFNNPYGIYADKNNKKVYIADQANQRIQILSWPNANSPNASFTADVSSGVAPLTVTFTDTSTGDPTSWLWEFGDGETSIEQNPSHEFTAGIWKIRLTATNDFGNDSAEYIIIAYEESSIPFDFFHIFRMPCGDVSIYAVDTANNQIIMYDDDEVELGTFGEFGDGDGQFNNPNNLAVANGLRFLERADLMPNPPQGSYVYVVDQDNARVQAFNCLGVYQFQIGGFSYPWGIATDGEYLYITDSGDNYIRVYDLLGNFLFQFGDDVMESPEGIAVDDNYVYVVGYTINIGGSWKIKVFVFTRQGEYITEFGDFENATFIYVDDNFIYVQDEVDGELVIIIYPKKRYSILYSEDILSLLNNINGEAFLTIPVQVNILGGVSWDLIIPVEVNILEPFKTFGVSVDIHPDAETEYEKKPQKPTRLIE